MSKQMGEFTLLNKSSYSGVNQGELWYDDTTYQMKMRANSVVVSPFVPALFPEIQSGSSYYMPGRVYNSAVSLTAITRDRVFYLPISVPEKVVVSKLFVYVTTGGASSNVLRAGLFDGSTGRPGTFEADWGTQVSTSTGVKTWSPGTTLRPGKLYWIGVASQVGTTCTVVCGTYHNPALFPQDSSAEPTDQNAFQQTAVFGYYRQDSVTGAFTNAGTILRDGAACPVMLVKLT